MLLGNLKLGMLQKSRDVRNVDMMGKKTSHHRMMHAKSIMHRLPKHQADPLFHSFFFVPEKYECDRKAKFRTRVM
jgi:hypothetical protein